MGKTMIPRRSLRLDLVIVVLLCTLSIFLFPATSGSYTAVHGPVTALRAARAFIATFWSMTLAVLGIARILPSRFVTLLHSQPVLSLTSSAARFNMTFRC
jgi:hypothetical protein